MIGDKSGFYSSTMRRPSPTHSGHPSVQMIREVFEHLGDGPITTISRLARGHGGSTQVSAPQISFCVLHFYSLEVIARFPMSFFRPGLLFDHAVFQRLI